MSLNPSPISPVQPTKPGFWSATFSQLERLIPTIIYASMSILIQSMLISGIVLIGLLVILAMMVNKLIPIALVLISQLR